MVHSEWDDIVETLRVRVRYKSTVGMEPSDYDERVLDAVNRWEGMAEHRATEILLSQLGEAAYRRYLSDVGFHAVIDLLVRVVVGAVFGRIGLTDAERNARMKALDETLAPLLMAGGHLGDQDKIAEILDAARYPGYLRAD